MNVEAEKLASASDAHPYTREERIRSFATCLVVFGLIGAFLVSLPLYMLISHTRDYGPAEKVENTLNEICADLESHPLELEQFDRRLQNEKYKWLRDIRVYDDVCEDELAWFKPNDRFSIGLCTDGRIVWKTNGKRATAR